MLLRNQWYAAAWGDEVGEQPLGVTLLNEPIVLFRGAENRVSALRDRCPHRALPLSKGRVVDGVLECGYHGLCFDGAGRCTKVPGQERVPTGAAVPAYPCIERWCWIWVWIGEPAMADPDLIPAFPWLGDPQWVAPHGRMHLRAAHELLIENLQNHTHLQFVHRRTVGTDEICSAETKVRRVGRQIHVERWLLDRPPPPLFARAGGFTGKVDRWAHGTFIPPTNTILDIGCAEAGTGARDGNRSRGITIRSLHSITPETDTTTHYFWAYARNFRIDDAHVTELLRKGALATFEEDAAVLEAQQISMTRFPGEPLLSLNCDAAGMAVNRLRGELARASDKSNAAAAEAKVAAEDRQVA